MSGLYFSVYLVYMARFDGGGLQGYLLPEAVPTLDRDSASWVKHGATTGQNWAHQQCW